MASNLNRTGPPNSGQSASGANVNRTGPPNSGQTASGPNVNRQGPPMNGTPLSRRRSMRRFHRATPKRQAPPPARPV